MRAASCYSEMWGQKKKKKTCKSSTNLFEDKWTWESSGFVLVHDSASSFVVSVWAFCAAPWCWSATFTARQPHSVTTRSSRLLPQHFRRRSLPSRLLQRKTRRLDWLQHCECFSFFIFSARAGRQEITAILGFALEEVPHGILSLQMEKKLFRSPSRHQKVSVH